MRYCYQCRTELPSEAEVHRSTLCPSCGKEMKVCKNCRHYSPGDHWDCRETIPEAVRDKDRANFCGFFQFDTARVPGEDSGKDQKAGQAKKNFDDLFS